MDVRARAASRCCAQLVATDPGAARLGELALVPHSSPISQTGHLFFNTLFDENAASHLAIGSAFRSRWRAEKPCRPRSSTRRRQPERHCRLHDRDPRTGRRWGARRWHHRARNAGGRVGGLTSPPRRLPASGAGSSPSRPDHFLEGPVFTDEFSLRDFRSRTSRHGAARRVQIQTWVKNDLRSPSAPKISKNALPVSEWNHTRDQRLERDPARLHERHRASPGARC